MEPLEVETMGKGCFRLTGLEFTMTQRPAHDEGGGRLKLEGVYCPSQAALHADLTSPQQSVPVDSPSKVQASDLQRSPL
jgi:hypothetical protein